MHKIHLAKKRNIQISKMTVSYGNTLTQGTKIGEVLLHRLVQKPDFDATSNLNALAASDGLKTMGRAQIKSSQR